MKGERFRRKTISFSPALAARWDQIRSTVGASVHSGRTIGVCARFSDPGSISRQIEFFLKIKEHDIPISDAAKLRHRTLPASPSPRYRLIHSQEFVFLAKRPLHPPSVENPTRAPLSRGLLLKNARKETNRFRFLSISNY